VFGLLRVVQEMARVKDKRPVNEKYVNLTSISGRLFLELIELLGLESSSEFNLMSGN
jgi:hypothetical protein